MSEKKVGRFTISTLQIQKPLNTQKQYEITLKPLVELQESGSLEHTNGFHVESRNANLHEQENGKSSQINLNGYQHLNQAQERNYCDQENCIDKHTINQIVENIHDRFSEMLQNHREIVQEAIEKMKSRESLIASINENIHKLQQENRKLKKENENAKQYKNVHHRKSKKNNH